MDLKSALETEHESQPEKTSETQGKETQTKKPIQLREIESRGSSGNLNGLYETKDTMNELLTNERENIYKKPWNKLELGMKLVKLKDFAQKEASENSLSESETNKLRDLLVNACKSNKLNKRNDVEYDSENCEIIKIKILQHIGNNYKLKTTENRVSKSSKSKSNIERLLNKRKK